MSDLRYLTIEELRRRKRACESEIRRLHHRLNTEQMKLKWIGIYSEKRKKEDIKAKVEKFMKPYKEG